MMFAAKEEEDRHRTIKLLYMIVAEVKSRMRRNPCKTYVIFKDGVLYTIQFEYNSLIFCLFIVHYRLQYIPEDVLHCFLVNILKDDTLFCTPN